jgi:hypothetical protein
MYNINDPGLQHLKKVELSEWEILTIIAKKSLMKYYRFRNDDMLKPYRYSIMWSIFGFDNSAGESNGLYLIQSDEKKQFELTFIDNFDNFNDFTTLADYGIDKNGKITILKIIKDILQLKDFLNGINLSLDYYEESDMDYHKIENYYFLRELRSKRNRTLQDPYENYTDQDAFNDATDGQCEGESWNSLGRD